MKNKSIILISCIIFYLLLSVVLNNFIFNKTEIYLGDYTKVNIKNNNIIIKNNNESISNKEIYYYNDTKFVKGYLYSESINNKKIYTVINDEKQKIKFLNDKIIATKKLNIKIYNPDFTTINSIESEEILKYLSKKSKFETVISIQKYEYDFNKDGVDEVLYAAVVNLNSDEYCTYILNEINDSFEIIDSAITNNTLPNKKRIVIYKYIDFDNDDNYELVIKENNGDDSPTYYNVYTYENGIFNKIEEE